MNILRSVFKKYLLCLMCFYSFNVHAQNTLDSLSSQPTAAYSTRLLSLAYTGPAMQIRRCSDDQLVDVFFDGVGIISLMSPVSVAGGGLATETLLGTWVTDNSAYVMIWYDQSGNGNNATQTIVAYQPRIVNAGVVEALSNGRPTVRMLNGATGGNGFNLPFSLLNAADINVFVALRQDGNTTIGNHIFGTSGPTGATPGKLQLHYYNTTQLGMQSTVGYGSSRLAVIAGSFISARFKITPDAGGTGQISNSSKVGLPVTGLLGTSLDASPLTLFRIGNNAYSRSFEGVSSEVICYISPVTNADANKILSYQNSSFVQAPPISNAATVIKNNGFTASWAAPSGGVSSSTYTYTLQYSTTADFSSGNVLVANIANTVFNRGITGLSSNTSYYYRVLINIPGTTGGDSGWSAVKSVTTMSVLPISLTNFDVEKTSNGALLNWKTASETNNKYFELERSIDGKLFTSIGTVDGAGNSFFSLSYTFIDKAPASGLNYYRLKQVDFDGNSTTFSPLVLDYKLTENSSFVYPNPAENTLNLNLGSIGGKITIRIVSISGIVVKQLTYNNEPLNISNLSPGTFMIEAISPAGDPVFRSKFIKK